MVFAITVALARKYALKERSSVKEKVDILRRKVYRT
jgi:hypothetical protein